MGSLIWYLRSGQRLWRLLAKELELVGDDFAGDGNSQLALLLRLGSKMSEACFVSQLEASKS